MLADRTSQILVCILVAMVCFLPTAGVMLWNGKRLIKRELNDDETVYYIRFSAFNRIIAIVCTIFLYGAAVLSLITLDGELVAFAIFLAFTLLSVFGWLVCLLWEIRVDRETLTFYRFPLPVKQIRFIEITNVRFVEKLVKGPMEGRMHLIGYGNGKKLFDIDGDMENSERLFQWFESERHPQWAYLKENGKEELFEVRESFSVTETLANRLRAVFFFVLGAGLYVGLLVCLEQLRQEDPDYYLFYILGSFVFLAVSAEELLRAMMWKLNVSYRTIQIRNTLGGTYSFSFDDIAALEAKEHYILLYVNGRKPVKVWMSYTNYALLVERLWKELNPENDNTENDDAENDS